MNDEAFESDYEGEVVLADEQEFGFETEFDQEQDEDMEVEYAAELLSLSGEGELDEFFSRLMRRVRGAASGIVNSQAGQQLKGLLRQTAKKALPLAGRAIGGYIGGSKGADFGGSVAGAAGRLFGLEMEGMSAEDQELEVAKRVVRLATDATRQIAAVPPGGDPRQAATSAFTAAASRHAPGLVRHKPRRGGGPVLGGGTASGAQGRWVRRGSKIVLFGV